MTSREEIKAALTEAGTIAGAARILGVARQSVQGRMDDELRALLKRPAKKTEASPVKAERPSLNVAGDSATIITPAAPELGEIGDLIRDAGLDPEEWVVLSTKVNAWDALAQGKGEDGDPVIVTLHQRKVTLARRPSVALVSPARHAPDVVAVRPASASVHEPDLIVVEGDHQAPYFDPALDAAATRFVADVQPVEHGFLGDGADFPTISRHPDHPAAMATAQECLDTYYGILRRRAEAAPNAKRWKLKGNHDWRLESELLGRAERMYGIRPVGEETHALSLERLLHLDAMKINLIEHPLGFEHAEAVIVPGPYGLVVRHGFVTGHNTGRRTLDKLGRSVIVGHDHSREHAWKRDYSAGTNRQAVVAGTMSRCDDIFPHYAINPDWHQGFVTVTRWPDGRFQIEHAEWMDGALTWRGRRWTAD